MTISTIFLASLLGLSIGSSILAYRYFTKDARRHRKLMADCCQALSEREKDSSELSERNVRSPSYGFRIVK